MTRIVNIAVGVLLAGSLSQFPEFSQQYVQRLGGALDELAIVVQDFDNSAAATGHSREAALASMTGSDFLDRRQNDMRRTIGRYEHLKLDYEDLYEANAYVQMAYIAEHHDRDIAGKAWRDFQPAFPLTLEGGALGLIGYLIGYGVLAALTGVLRGWRHRRPA